ncbi:MAG: hypothetical protein IMW98_06310 [Firmicutes bacterium]|nr:hypothetical protein [Bacillota bacterium]
MDDIKQRVAYLQGLASTLDVEALGAQGQVLTGILDVLDDMAHTLAAVERHQEDLEDYLVDLDENLADLEEDLGAAQEEAGTPARLAARTEAWWSFTCPECGTVIEVSDDAFDDDEHVELICPHCGHLIHDYGEEFAYGDDDSRLLDKETRSPST